MRFKEQLSINGYYWNIKKYDENLALSLYQKKHVSTTVSKLLAIRNIGLDKIDDFLNPKIKSSLKDPYHLLDMDRAVNAIYEAILSNRKICIFGDYDVDGATATALMVLFFRNIGVEVTTYIPDRSEDGYGLSEQAIEKLKQQGINFIITVDCGISCFDAVEFAKSLAIDIVITDHHIGPTLMPRAVAVVNPNRLDEKSEYKYLAGVGVAFLVCIAFNTHLRNVDYYKKNNLKEQNLLRLLDLVALGTVCDVMPLVNINRAFVKQGLEIFKRKNNLGLTVLSEVIGLKEINDTYHLGYVVGPRINAGGRVGDASIGNRLLSCEDRKEARYLVEQLNSFNIARQNIEKNILSEAVKQINSGELFNNPVIFIEGVSWHEGVIGIIASRIKDRYNRPVFVISKDGEFGKASCRSVDKSVDIGSVIVKAKEQKLILSGGGHAMAGGFTFEISKLSAIKKFIESNIKTELNSYLGKNERYADLVLGIDALNEQLAAEIGQIGPFGSDNPKPIIILENVVVFSARKFDKNSEHVQCTIGTDGIFGSKNTIVANIFRVNSEKINKLLFSGSKNRYDFIGNISINKWLVKNNIQFIVEDIIVNQ
ncbi:MAG: single-stranded-DNA-specific exonuclease RecJ [Rickettsiales bacterium]|jgi:single-stranded-DNA-specific exonuclease|nr:single-stranded-DNA-specific exonuclease RecJ [Rickettsiales bacterium]